MSDPIFDAEQRHLSETHRKLEAIERDALRKLEQTAAAAAADKDSMTEDVAGNFASDDEAMETYAAIAAVNRIIDGYNISQEVNTQRLSDARLLLRQPYFAKLSLRFPSTGATRDLYIGNAGMTDDDCSIMVADWRSPVAEVYYNQENGRTSYVANGRTIEVDLELRRQFDIEGARLNAYFDTNVAIQDELLLSSLSQQRSAHMQAITATIQKEQNRVVRHEDVPTLLVHGIAGSGKTSVLFQRIAYLFYRQRDTLRPDEVRIITPNPLFGRYVDTVLPDMGESNPVLETWDDFASRMLPPGRGGRLDDDVESLWAAEDAVASLRLETRDFRDIECDGVRFISTAQVAQAFRRHAGIAPGPHLTALVREDLLGRVDSRLAQMAGSERVQDEVLALGVDEQLNLYGEQLVVQDEDALREAALRYVTARYAGARAAVENDEWLRIDRIGMRLTGAQTLSPVMWLYVKMALCGADDARTRYVMVDEVQDYTPAQLAVLARCFRRAHFMLLGDKHQAIKEETSTFDEIRRVFERGHAPVSSCDLLTSYRSSPEITGLFARLLPEDERGSVASVQPAQGEPRVFACEGEEERVGRVRALVREGGEGGESGGEGSGGEGIPAGLTAVVLPDNNQVRLLAQALGDDAPPILGPDDALPEGGTVMLPLKLAKGLEFDRVIVPDASERAFPDTPLGRNRLYTTISRATRTLDLVALGQPTPLLKGGLA